MFISTVREGEWFNEYDFLELCEDLITSKREHFKAIRGAIHNLEEKGHILKAINKFGELVYSSPWASANTWMETHERMDPNEIEWPETDLEQKVREFHNQIYNCSVPHNWQRYHGEDALKEDLIEHYVNFRDAIMRTIRDFQDPETFKPFWEGIASKDDGDKKTIRQLSYLKYIIKTDLGVYKQRQ